METSTSISSRREPQAIDLEDDSPVDENIRNVSTETLNTTDEVIPDSRTKAGMSNELDSMIVTLPKEVSPNTMDRRLVLHCVDIARAAVGNPLVTELDGDHGHT